MNQQGQKTDIRQVITIGVLIIGFAVTWGQNVQKNADTCEKIEKVEARQDKTEVEQNEVNKELISAINNLNISITELRAEIKYKKGE